MNRLTPLAAVDTPTTTSVYPSGLLRATSCVPMMPLAPGLFSTTTGWPRSMAICLPRLRATTSVMLPGGKGTTIRIGWSG
ncbi:hypothetical protein D3C87_1550730 [compost metagenome]